MVPHLPQRLWGGHPSQWCDTHEARVISVWMPQPQPAPSTPPPSHLPKALDPVPKTDAKPGEAMVAFGRDLREMCPGRSQYELDRVFSAQSEARLLGKSIL